VRIFRGIYSTAPASSVVGMFHRRRRRTFVCCDEN
jgi:hypothetical protein